MSRLCLVLASVLAGAMLVQTVAAEEESQAEAVYREWLKKIRLIEIQHLRSTSSSTFAEGRTKLLAMQNAAAVGPMVDVLYGPNPRYRGLLIEALTAMMAQYSDMAVAYLQEIAVGDGSGPHRRRAIESLKQAPSPDQTNRLMAHLALDDVPIIRDRAATALAALGDKRAVWLLVERLVTEDVRMVGGEVWSGSMQLDIRFQVAGIPRFRQVTISAAVPGGGIATAQIQLPEVEIVDVATTIAMTQHGTPVPHYERVQTQHPEVLAALKQLTGKDFGYNQAAWQKWLESEEARTKVPPWEPIRFKTG
ncbi:MAG: HEAT repeat domain-containing protein [Planctomycetes bacterium]|nr:HEAT repeat domain-containing protein [Planctomycetota bacterium]